MASWRSSVQEVDRVLGEQNPWHSDGLVPGVGRLAWRVRVVFRPDPRVAIAPPREETGR